MSRLVFPNDRLVYSLQGEFLIGKSGVKVYLYTDAAATSLADVTDMADVAILGSYITVGADSLLPLFKGPNDGTDTLYAMPEGTGAVAQALYARTDDRVDALATAVATNTGQVATNTAAIAANSSAIANPVMSYRQFLYGGIL